MKAYPCAVASYSKYMFTTINGKRVRISKYHRERFACQDAIRYKRVLFMGDREDCYGCWWVVDSRDAKTLESAGLERLGAVHVNNRLAAFARADIDARSV